MSAEVVQVQVSSDVGDVGDVRDHVVDQVGQRRGLLAKGRGRIDGEVRVGRQGGVRRHREVALAHGNDPEEAPTGADSGTAGGVHASASGLVGVVGSAAGIVTGHVHDVVGHEAGLIGLLPRQHASDVVEVEIQVRQRDVRNDGLEQEG